MSDSTLLFLCVTVAPWVAVWIWIKVFQWYRPSEARTLPGMHIKRTLEAEMNNKEHGEEVRV